MMSRQVNEAVLRKHLAAENRHDLLATLDTVHPDCVFADEPLGLELHGRDGAREHYEMWWAAFGATVEDGTLHWVRDDFAIGEARFAGTHVGPFAGVAATGTVVSLPFVVFVRFRDGRRCLHLLGSGGPVWEPFIQRDPSPRSPRSTRAVFHTLDAVGRPVPPSTT